jgi:ribose 5-phosphate isomerase A
MALYGPSAGSYPAGMDPKQRAGEAALEHVQSGMVVGLGTGSTAKFFIAALASALRSGKLKDVRGIPTSSNSERLARESGLPVTTFSQAATIDLTVDGADEIAPGLTLIKGMGGALLREKIVAQNSRKMIIIADQSKVVSKLGMKSPLPVEVAAFGHEASARFLRGLGCVPVLRRHPDGAVFVTDNGNYIYDCRFQGIEDPAGLDRQFGERAGIVESGLFLNLAQLAIVADDQNIQILQK